MAKKNPNSIPPKWLKLLREYIATLEKQDATREKLAELRRQLLESCTSEAAQFQSISPERRLMLKLALQLKPIPSATHVLEAAMSKNVEQPSQQDPRAVSPNGREEKAGTRT